MIAVGMGDVEALSTRYAELQEQIEEIACEIAETEAARNARLQPLGIVRPPYRFVGWTDQDVLEAASRMGRDPFAADWWCDLDPDVMADFAPVRYGRSKAGRATDDTARIEQLREDRTSLEAEAARVLAALERSYDEATRGLICAGSGGEVSPNEWGEIPLHAWRLCPICETLQRVENGRLVEHEMEHTRKREAA